MITLINKKDDHKILIMQTSEKSCDKHPMRYVLHLLQNPWTTQTAAIIVTGINGLTSITLHEYMLKPSGYIIHYSFRHI